MSQEPVYVRPYLVVCNEMSNVFTVFNSAVYIFVDIVYTSCCIKLLILCIWV